MIQRQSIQSINVKITNSCSRHMSSPCHLWVWLCWGYKSGKNKVCMSKKMDCGQIMSMFQTEKRDNGRWFAYPTKKHVVQNMWLTWTLKIIFASFLLYFMMYYHWVNRKHVLMSKCPMSWFQTSTCGQGYKIISMIYYLLYKSKNYEFRNYSSEWKTKLLPN